MSRLNELRTASARDTARLAEMHITAAGRTHNAQELDEIQDLEIAISSYTRNIEAAERQAAREPAPAVPVPLRPVMASAAPRISGGPAVLTRTTQEQRNGDRFEGQAWARINLARIK